MRGRIKRYIRIVTDGFHCLAERIKNHNAAYLIMTPEHGNLGDHAIAQAEKELFSKHDIRFIELSGKELQRRRSNGGLTRLMNGRPILVHGGGYLGTLWIDAEMLLRDIIKQNPRSQIVLLPNTVYYEDTPKGRNELAKSVDIYNAHHALTVYTRELPSYSKAKEIYRDVRLMPDMVMYMNKTISMQERSGCILCLRADHEKTRTNEDEHSIIQQVTALFGDNYYYRDMCVNYSIPISDRDKELEKQYDAFRRADLVVTDRLHGMIFSAITGTPCIVIDSKSHKVRGCYEWIKDLDYVRFADDASSIVEEYHRIPKGEHHYDNSRLIHYYEELAEEIRNDLLRGKKKCR